MNLAHRKQIFSNQFNLVLTEIGYTTIGFISNVEY